jgi:hypothetical protein
MKLRKEHQEATQSETKIDVDVTLLDINAVPPAQAAAMRKVCRELFAQAFQKAEKR